MPSFWLPPALALVVTWLVLSGLLRRHVLLPMDHPNERSLHAAPVPRVGGVALMGGTLAAALALPGAVWAWLVPALALAVVSLLDDVRGLPVAWRFAAHAAAAAGFVAWAAPDTPLFAIVALTLVFVWMTNLYNFMDGSDGLAGGQALFGFATYGLAAWWIDAPELAVFCFSLVAAALGFLRFNFHPARVFMGDAGSIPLGFLAAALGFEGWRRGLWSPTLPLLAFSPFIVDASVTLTRRLLRGEKIWRAHKSHYYQRLVRMGLGHRGTALAEYALMAAVAGSALLAERWGLQMQALLAWCAIYSVLMLGIDRAWQRFEATA
jgi:UDP-N-acetylmuramyl pentapeptide phosphotransferase/UDP-N-acetylglucosamine-1-phosphate transferase